MWNDPKNQPDADYNFAPPPPEPSPEQPAPSSSPTLREPILGMNAPQRFVVALFLLMAVCIVGALFLVVFGKVVPF